MQTTKEEKKTKPSVHFTLEDDDRSESNTFVGGAEQLSKEDKHLSGVCLVAQEDLSEVSHENLLISMIEKGLLPITSKASSNAEESLLVE